MIPTWPSTGRATPRPSRQSPRRSSSGSWPQVRSEAQACALLAEEIARDHGLDEQAVELCKAAALERFEAER